MWLGALVYVINIYLFNQLSLLYSYSLNIRNYQAIRDKVISKIALKVSVLSGNFGRKMT